MKTAREGERASSKSRLVKGRDLEALILTQPFNPDGSQPARARVEYQIRERIVFQIEERISRRPGVADAWPVIELTGNPYRPRVP